MAFFCFHSRVKTTLNFACGECGIEPRGKSPNLEKGLHFSKAYDELPREVIHTSFLLKCDIEDLSEVANGTQMNRVSYEISEFNKALGENDSEKAYEDILNKYAPYAKNN